MGAPRECWAELTALWHPSTEVWPEETTSASENIHTEVRVDPRKQRLLTGLVTGLLVLIGLNLWLEPSEIEEGPSEEWSGALSVGTTQLTEGGTYSKPASKFRPRRARSP